MPEKCDAFHAHHICGKLLLAHPGSEVAVDLETLSFTRPDGRSVPFPLEAFARYCLLEGIDELGYLLNAGPAIDRYEADRPA